MGLFEEIKQVVGEQLGVKPGEITSAASFRDDLGADSLDAVDLILALEEKFGIEIPDADAEAMLTVNDAVEYIGNRINKPQNIEENEGGIRT